MTSIGKAAPRNTILLITLYVALAAALATMLIPLPNDWVGTTHDFQRLLFNAAIYCVLTVGAAVLFLRGARVYKAKLRTAYFFIASSFVLQSLGMMEITLFYAFGWIHNIWYTGGGVVLPFIFQTIAIQVGVRMLAKQVNLRSPLLKLVYVVPIFIIGMYLATLLPHAPSTTPEEVITFFRALTAWTVIGYAISLILALKIRANMGSHYTPAMSWLAVSLFVTLLSSVISIVTMKFGETQSLVIDICMIVNSLAQLKAAHTFASTEEL